MERVSKVQKSIAASIDGKAVGPKGKEKVVEIVTRPKKERLPLPPIEENPIGDDEMDSESDIDVVCNVVSILPAEYDVVSEVKESEDDYNPEDMEKYKSMLLCTRLWLW